MVGWVKLSVSEYGVEYNRMWKQGWCSYDVAHVKTRMHLSK